MLELWLEQCIIVCYDLTLGIRDSKLRVSSSLVCVFTHSNKVVVCEDTNHGVEVIGFNFDELAYLKLRILSLN